MRFIRVIGIFSLVYFLFCITPNEAKAEVDCNATIITPEPATTICGTRCNCRRVQVASASNCHSGHGHCKAWPFRPPPLAAAGLTMAVAGMRVPP